MSSNNILVGQMIIVMAIIVGGTWAATEWTAAHLGFQARLGCRGSTFRDFPFTTPGDSSSGGTRMKRMHRRCSIAVE